MSTQIDETGPSTQQKRLETKARKQQEAAEEARILAEETAGGRRAKGKALANAIWKNPNATTNRRKRAPSVAQEGAEAKKARKSQPPNSGGKKDSLEVPKKPASRNQATASKTAAKYMPVEDIDMEDAEAPAKALTARVEKRQKVAGRSQGNSNRAGTRVLENESGGDIDEADADGDEPESDREPEEVGDDEPGGDGEPEGGDGDGLGDDQIEEEDNENSDPGDRDDWARDKEYEWQQRAQWKSPREKNSNTSRGQFNSTASNDVNDVDGGNRAASQRPSEKPRGTATTKVIERRKATHTAEPRWPAKQQARKDNTPIVLDEDTDSGARQPRRPAKQQARKDNTPIVLDDDTDSGTRQPRRPAKQQARKDSMPIVLDDDSDSGAKNSDDPTAGDDEESATSSTNTDLVYDPGQRYIRIKAQSEAIQAVLHSGIDAAKYYGLWVNAFPPGDEINVRMRTILRNVAQSLKENAIARRLNRDIRYGNTMAHLLKVRLGSLRTFTRDAARHTVEAKYGLVSGCREKIISLTTNDHFIFARDSAGHIIKKKPYCHDAIIAVLQCFFEDPASFGQRNLNSFESSIPNDPAYAQPEIPIPMLALVATMIYAELLCWSQGERAKSKFNADSHCDTYHHHVRVLKAIFEQNKLGFHRMMSDLFKMASASKKQIVPTVDDNQTLAVLDVDAMDV
ncbi:hypothetical protein BD779DRAFT_1478033 [Infundibulicybe gibba]|nr:hypothetical protein BD779DRAFT_1478033 [Infundibulicybe gibba]